MIDNKKIAVIIAAAGSGNRMGSGIPKQYLKIKDRTIIERAVEAFDKNASIDSIYVVVNNEYLEYCRLLFQGAESGKVQSIIKGGKERQDSIFAALTEIPEDIDYVLVHDGARPFVTEEIINRLIDKIIINGAAAVAVPVKDTIKTASDNVFSQTLDRSLLYAVQTPQGFERKLLIAAYEKAFDEKYYGTDDSVLVEKFGQKVYLVDGDYENIKITTKEDLIVGEAIIKARYSDDIKEDIRIGTGYDVHRLAEDRKLVLGGVHIPFEKGLLGHSDADVLIHAIMDALLGACGLGDIGKHFPDKDETYRGISSLVLLRKVKELVHEEGYQAGNIDVTIIAQRPKILPHIEEMRKNIADVLGITIDRINIKGTTTENLGFCGREEGIAAQASALIKRRNNI